MNLINQIVLSRQVRIPTPPTCVIRDRCVQFLIQKMEKIEKYSFTVKTNFHIENFLSANNIANDSYFWLEEDDGFRALYFSSTLLSDFTDPQEIYDNANQILSIYEGIYKLLDRNRQINKYFTLLDLYDTDKNEFISHSRKSEIYKVDIDFKKSKYSNNNRPINSIYKLFETITQNEFLTNLFFLISNQVDYRMLYIIYDDIRFYLKENKDKTFLNQYSKDLKRFTHTANNFEVLGFYSRHGRTNHEPPKDPINLEDSKNLIFDIIKDLLKEKFKVELPEYWGLAYIDFNDLDFNDLDFKNILIDN